MNFQSYVTERLLAISEALNQINLRAKKIDDLPVQSTLDPSSKIHVSRNGESESLQIQQIIDSITGGIFKTYRTTYTGGPQRFTLPGGISQALLVFVNGQQWDDVVQFTYNTTSVTVIDTLKVGAVVSIIYSEAPVNSLPIYTRAEQNDLFLLKSDYNEVERFLEYKKADLISPNLMIDYVGDKGFADSGVRIDRDYVLEEMSITFGRFVNASAILVPIQIRVHEPNASTQSTPVTGTLIKELECFSDPSNVFNKVFDYNFPDEDWSAYTGKFITVNTANFILGGSTLEDVLVTIKLRKK